MACDMHSLVEMRSALHTQLWTGSAEGLLLTPADKRWISRCTHPHLAAGLSRAGTSAVWHMIREDVCLSCRHAIICLVVACIWGDESLCDVQQHHSKAWSDTTCAGVQHIVWTHPLHAGRRHKQSTHPLQSASPPLLQSMRGALLRTHRRCHRCRASPPSSCYTAIHARGLWLGSGPAEEAKQRFYLAPFLVKFLLSYKHTSRQAA